MDHLLIEMLQHIRHVKLAVVDSDLGVQEYLQKQIPHLIAKRFRIVCVQGLQDFIGFFYQERGAGTYASARDPKGQPSGERKCAMIFCSASKLLNSPSGRQVK